MKKVNTMLNTIMGCFVGGFIGHAVYGIWSFKTHPEVYAMQSAPWYTSILVWGAFTLAVLVVCSLLKIILKHFIKKADRDSIE